MNNKGSWSFPINASFIVVALIIAFTFFLYTVSDLRSVQTPGSSFYNSTNITIERAIGPVTAGMYSITLVLGVILAIWVITLLIKAAGGGDSPM